MNVVVPKDKITVTGTPKEFLNPGDSGNRVIRSFCDTCGASLFSDLPDGMPTIRIVKAGSIDDGQVVPKPVRQVFCDSKQGWVDPSIFVGVEQVARS